MFVVTTALAAAIALGPVVTRSQMPADWRATRALVTGALPDLDRAATYRLGYAGKRAFSSINYGVLRELLRRGFDVRVGEAERAYTDSAHSEQDEADAELRVVSAGWPVDGGTLVAQLDQGAEARARLDHLSEEAHDLARANVTAAGRAAARNPQDALGEAMATVLDGEPTSPLALAVLSQAGFTNVPWSLLEDLADLESEASRLEPLAIWVVPLP